MAKWPSQEVEAGARVFFDPLVDAMRKGREEGTLDDMQQQSVLNVLLAESERTPELTDVMIKCVVELMISAVRCRCVRDTV